MFAILTQGPCPTIDVDTLDEAIAYAQQNMPLRRGWTFDVTRNEDGTAATVRVRNSRGRIVNACRVRKA